jgi:urocanate hydratase
MPTEQPPPPALDFLIEVERLYTALIQSPNLHLAAGEEPSQGGQLLYVGELDARGRALVVGANIAGAASLAATADIARQKQSIREGIADFLVTSLDESLRILKNEIRKREAVAVCVAQGPEAVEQEMRERGVVPDLLGLGMAGCSRSGAEDTAILTWSVATAPVRWMPRLDVMALDCLGRDEYAARRWLRLASRFAGRLSTGVQVLRCEPKAAEKFVARVESGVARAEIGVPVEIEMTLRGQRDRHRFAPPGGTRAEC